MILTSLRLCKTRRLFRGKCSSEFLRILWAQSPADDPSVLSNMSLVYRLRDYNNGLVVQKPVQCHLTTALPILRGNLVHDLERSSTTLRNPSLPERTIGDHGHAFLLTIRQHIGFDRPVEQTILDLV